MKINKLIVSAFITLTSISMSDIKPAQLFMANLPIFNYEMKIAMIVNSVLALLDNNDWPAFALSAQESK